MTAATVVAVPAAAITGLVRRWLLRQVRSSLPPASLDPSVGSELGSEMGLALAGLLVIVVATIVASNLVTAASFGTVSGA